MYKGGTGAVGDGGLRESERRLRAVVTNAPVVLFALDREGVFTLSEGEGLKALGLEPGEVVGLSVFDVYRDAPEVLRDVRRALGGEGVSAVAEVGALAFEVAYNPLLGECGEVLGVIGVATDVTERKRAEEELRRSEGSLSEAQRIAHVGDWEYDVGKDEARWSDEMYRIFGFAPRSFVPTYKTFLASAHPDDGRRLRKAVREALYREERGDIEYRTVRPDGEVRFVLARYEVVRAGDDAPIKLTGTVQDVTERARHGEALRESEERYRLVARATNEVIWDNDLKTGKQRWDGAIEAMFGYGQEELGEDGPWWEERIHPEDRRRVLSGLEAVLEGGGEVWTDEYRFRRKDGSYAAVVDRGYVVRVGGGEPARMLGAMLDITERKALEERLARQALRDPLTGLPNRRLFVDRLEQALGRTRRRRGRKAAVLFVDLDGFKVVNDSLGHDVGDRLLVAVAERLRACLRPEDSLSRFGGDEFAVLQEDVEGPEEALRVAERITEALREPFLLHGRELFVAASIGIALGDARRERPEDLLRDADTAMYEAKKAVAAPGHRVFDPAMRERVLDRLGLENDLRRAIGREEFRLLYQPKFRLGAGKIAEVEALLRWEHPHRGLLLPDEFVPLAEQTGLIVPIGRWVLKETCRRVKGWQDRHPKTPPLVACVNVSAGQLRYPGLLDDVGSALRESGLEARSLALEITESALVKDMETSITVLKELRALGVRFALDDFGSEYSSLSYLMRLPVDFVKIDKSFVRGLGEDPRASVVVEAIISLAHALGLEAVGEGVESAEQLEGLRRMGCDIVQGYHLARPLPSEEVESLLEEGLTP